MATIKFSKKASEYMGAGKAWPNVNQNLAGYHPGYGLWDTTASSAIFGGPAGTSTIHSVLNVYKGAIPTISQFKDLKDRESDLLVSFELASYTGNVLEIGYIPATRSYRYVCGRQLNFKRAQQSGEATWFAAVNYRELSFSTDLRAETSTWVISLSPLTNTQLFNEQISARVVNVVPVITGTVSTLISTTITTTTAVLQFSTPATGTVFLSYTATFFGGGFDGTSTVSPSKGVIPADSFLYGTFTQAGGAYDYSGAPIYAHYRRGAMIGTVGPLYSTADLQILTTNIVAGQNYNCAGIFLNFPQDWTI